MICLVSPSYFVPRGWPNANSFVAYCQFQPTITRSTAVL